MNETMQTLLARRSIRKYKPDPVPEDLLRQVVEAGVYAPSGMNRQSWKLVVARGEARDRVTAAAAPFPNRGGNPFYGAPVILLVFGDPNDPMWIQDGSLMLGNMMNAAAAVGLGSCWINCMKDVFGTPEGEKLQRELLPDAEYRVVGCLALGYADEAPEPKPRRENVVTYLD